MKKIIFLLLLVVITIVVAQEENFVLKRKWIKNESLSKNFVGKTGANITMVLTQEKEDPALERAWIEDQILANLKQNAKTDTSLFLCKEINVVEAQEILDFLGLKIQINGVEEGEFIKWFFASNLQKKYLVVFDYLAVDAKGNLFWRVTNAPEWTDETYNYLVSGPPVFLRILKYR
jgi:hypothetical protein